MSLGSQIAWFRKIVQRGFAVLALLALALVLARPICDAYGVGVSLAGVGQGAGGEQSHHDDCDPSRTSIDDGAPLASASAAPVAMAATEILMSAMQHRVAAIPPDRPPLLRPYHARTARILI